MRKLKFILQKLVHLIPRVAFESIRLRDLSQGLVLHRRKVLLTGYCYPGTSIGFLRSIQFVKAWRTKYMTKRPFPGFSPHVYAAHTPTLGHLDPTLHFVKSGRPDGPWTREVISPSGPAPLESELEKIRRVAIHIHVFYPEELAFIVAAILTNKSIPDIFITYPPDVNSAQVTSQLENYSGKVNLIPLSRNVGRDIGPFFSSLPEYFFKDYELVAHVHTKRSIGSVEAIAAKRWFEFMTVNLFGSPRFPGMLDRILFKFLSERDLGLVYADDPHVMGWTQNYSVATQYFAPDDLPRERELFDFPIGSFFIARPRALYPILNLGLVEGDYPQEPIGYDGTILHAMERLIGVCPKLTNLRSAVTFVPGQSR